MTISQFGKVQATTISSEADIAAALQRLGIDTGQPTLVLVGGAGGMSEEQIAQTQAFFADWVAPFVIEKKLAVVDGGTDSGIMKAMGLARTKHNADFPLVGVAVETLLREEPWLVEQNHSHLLTTPGADWGDEVALLSRTATIIAGGKPSMTVLFNGGQITWRDAEASINENRPVLVAEGSGRAADDISQTQTGMKIDMRAIKLIQTGLIRIANPYTDPQKFMTHLKNSY
jgi:hypothetical protein